MNINSSDWKEMDSKLNTFSLKEISLIFQKDNQANMDLKWIHSDWISISTGKLFLPQVLFLMFKTKINWT